MMMMKMMTTLMPMMMKTMMMMAMIFTMRRILGDSRYTCSQSSKSHMILMIVSNNDNYVDAVADATMATVLILANLKAMFFVYTREDENLRC